MSSQRKRSLGSARHRNGAAFTLIELLVVLGIIGLLVGITAPLAIQASRQGNLPMAINSVSAALNVARSIALRDGKETAVLFSSSGESSVQLRIVVKNDMQTDATHYGFHDYDDRAPDSLGKGVSVMGADFNTFTIVTVPQWKLPATRLNVAAAGTIVNGWTADAGAANPSWLGVWFAADGSPKTMTDAEVGYLFYYDVDYLPAGPLTYTPGNSSTPAETSILWVPFFAVYDNNDFSSRDQAVYSDIQQWLNQGLDASADMRGKPRIVSFNRYSGALQKR